MRKLKSDNVLLVGCTVCFMAGFLLFVHGVLTRRHIDLFDDERPVYSVIGKLQRCNKGDYEPKGFGFDLIWRKSTVRPADDFLAADWQNWWRMASGWVWWEVDAIKEGASLVSDKDFGDGKMFEVSFKINHDVPYPNGGKRAHPYITIVEIRRVSAEEM